METIRVWNKEVDSCYMCSYGRNNYCKYNNRYVPHNFNILIDEDCPFKQKITKEVIESFGFKFHAIFSQTERYLKNEYILLLNVNTSKIRIGISIENGCDTIFNAVLHNPEELKFILKCCKIIE